MKTGIKNPHDYASSIKETLQSEAVSPEIFEEKFQPIVDYIEELEGKIRLLQKQVFASRTEKRPVPENDGQMLLFNEAETESGLNETDRTAEEETIDVPAHKRVRPKRKPLPESLERVEVIHDIDESEKICGCGACLEKIGEDTSEKLDIIPAKIRVIRHIRPKYACRKCEGTESEDQTVKIAPVPAQIIPKGIPTEGLLAWIVVSKFCDSLTLYRQEVMTIGYLSFHLSARNSSSEAAKSIVVAL